MGAFQSKARGSKPFISLAELYTRNEERTSIQLDLLRPVAEYELQQKGCGSYFFLLPAHGDNTTTITLFETFDSRAYMVRHHHGSDKFQQMKDLETESNVRRAKTYHIFMAPVGGFLERKVPSGISPAEQFHRITKLACDPSKRADAISTLTTHAEYLLENANEVLSYFVATVMDDPGRFMLFERYPSEEIASTIWSHKRSQAVVSKLLSLNVTQITQNYRAVRGFLSKKEEFI